MFIDEALFKMRRHKGDNQAIRKQKTEEQVLKPIDRAKTSYNQE